MKGASASSKDADSPDLTSGLQKVTRAPLRAHSFPITLSR